jgi:hypothetical protein
MAQKAVIQYGNVDITGIKAAIGKFNKTQHKQMILLMKGAVRVFVKTTVQYIGVDTGMTGGTLQPVAQEVGTGVLAEVRARMKNSSRTGFTTMTGRYYRSRKRSMDEGIKAGQNAYVLKFGTVKRPRMIFTFNTKVYQFALWEPRRWHSLNFGLEAMVAYINQNFDTKFPYAEMIDALNIKQKVGQR